MTMTSGFRASIFGLATLVAVAFGSLVQAQAVPDPNDSTLPTFGCTGDIYQVQSGQLRIFDPITSTYTNIGSNQGSYNATGYNVIDGYAYASQGRNIIRIGSDGDSEVVYDVGFGTYSGDLDRSNNFYLRRNNNRYDRVDLATGNITTLNFTGVGGGPADVAFIPGGGDRLIGFSGGQMFIYNLTSLQKTRLNVTGGMPGGGYGATWTDAAGRLFTFNNNTGLLFEIFDYNTNAPRAVQVGVGVPSGNNDGFSCSLANFPNLAPVAQDDDFSTPVNVAITGDVTADNGNGIDNDPDGGVLAVTGPDSGPSNGTLVLNGDGTFSYTPNTYFLGTDTFTYTVTDPAGLTATATVTIDVTGDVSFEVDKRRVSGVAVATAEGQVVNYQIEVENTGDIPLTGINIVDTLPNGSAGTLTGPVEGGGTDGRDQPGRIDVGETWTYTISYTIEQGDIDGGGPLVNTVAVTTTETGTDVESDTAAIPVDQDDSFTFAKSTDVTSFAAVNDPVVFTFTVENTGNVTLTDVVVTDPFFDPDYSCTIATLAPGITDNTTCTFTYNVTQADIDRGEIVNVAAANANGAGGAALPEQTDTVTLTGPAEVAAVRIVKTDEGGDLAFGPVNDLETFTFQVFNDGDVTLTNLVVSDPALAFTCPLADLAPGANTSVCANGDPLSVDLTITQALVDAATYTNTVTVTGETTQGTNVSDDDTLVLTGPTQDLQLIMAKSVTGGDNFSAVGDVVTYDYVVTNDGNITITSQITVADNRTSVSCPVLPAGGLAPQATITCTASYAVTQGDLNAGSVTNLATASVTQTLANGSTVTETSPQVSATANADRDPAIAIAKELTSITDEDGTPQTTLTYDEVDDVLNYMFTVTNTGNVTLLDQIVVTDTDIGATVNCGPAAPNLAPGDSVTCTASHLVTQPNLNDGSFVNTASAATTFNGGAVNTPTPASATAFAQQTPALTLAKSEDAPNVTVLTVGGTIDYTYVATNTGNVTLTDPITIDDDRFPSGGVVCPTFPAGGLAPGGIYTCNATYTITANDVFIGTVVNNATATSGTTTSPPATVTVPTGATPALDVTKNILSITDPAGGTPSGLQFNEVDDVLTFEFEIENTGTVAFVRPITVTDPMLTPNPITCFTPTGSDPDFQPTERATCTGQYTIMQNDLDAGEVINTAFASVEFNDVGQGPSTYNSPTATETVPAAANPELTVAKDVTAGPDPATANDLLTYTITATNSGNQTLSDVSLSDPLIPSLTCTVGGVAAPASVTLEPGEVLTCTGDYTVTQENVDTQTLSNTATATGLSPNGSPVTATGTDTHPLAAPQPNIEVIKTLTAGTPTPAYTEEGDTVSFTVEVRNNGNVTLTSIDVTDSLVPGTCTIGPLAPGDNDDSCRFVYTVPQSAVDDGEIDNTATGVATPIASSGAGPITRTGNLITPGPTRTPGITLTKTADLTSFNAALQTITYTFEIENTGNITLTGTPAINDPDATGITCNPLPAGGLLPGGTVTCTGTYETEQADVDAGQVVNTATASLPNPLDPGTPLTSTGSVTVPAVQTPSITLTKTPDVANFTGANQTITYTYVIENTGNVTLTAAPVLTDDRIGATDLSCDPVPAGGLLPTATLSCTGAYETTQPDVNAGGVSNVAEVAIDDPTNPGTPLTASATATVPAVRNAVIEVVKTPSMTSGVAVGDTITYSYLVTNRGNVTLTNTVLDDQHVSASGTAPLAISNGGVILSLDPLASTTLTAQYVVTQADIDAGAALTNTVTATATAPTGVTAPTDNDVASVSLSPAAPELSVIKDVPNLPASLVAGTDVTFRIRVQNTGNVTLDNVVLTDTLGRLDGSVISMPPPVGPVQDVGTIGELDVGETWEYALTYTLTQEDVDAGGISNSVLAEATDPSGTPVSDLSDGSSPAGDAPTLVQIPAAPSIEAIKTITTPATTVGGQVVFQIAVENTGNVTLTNVGIASDTITRLGGAAVTGAISGPTFASADGGSPSGTLTPGETAFYTLTYTLTQEDVDAGGVQNTATATGTPPSGPPVTDISDDDGIGDDNPTVQEILPTLGLTLDKVLASGGPTFDDTSDVLTFDFIVTNTGNVTLTDPIVIDDPLIAGAGGSVICPPGDVAPGGVVTCMGSYTVTQPNLDDGFVTNSATASSAFNGTPVVSPADDVTVPAAQEPELTLLKEAAPLNPADFVVGAVVTYTYTVTNTGNVTLTDPVTITDDRIVAADIVCPPFPSGGLAPSGVYVCTADYTVTGDDVDVGSVVNNATATSGTTVSPPDSETTPTGATPALDVVKTLASVTDAGGTVRPGGEFLAVGDILNYSFTVTNTGTRAFVGDIDVIDPLIAGGSVTCWTRVPGTDEDFRSGETATCTGSYTITQPDLDAGEVVNTAYASTTFGSIPTTYNSPTDSVTSPGDADPEITFDKRVISPAITAVGQTITYEFEVENTGNQTLTNIAVTDPLLPGLSCTVATLDPGDNLICSEDYIVTQDDVDAGTVINTATAAGTTPAGTSVTDTDGETTTMPAAMPMMTLGKTASPDPFGPLGSDVIYTFTVANTGNVTLRNIVVTDILDPTYSCTVPDLAPGDSNSGCTLAYTVTQGDVDAAEITNSATVSATPERGTLTPVTTTITTPGPAPAPALELTKTSSVDFLGDGGTVTYTFTVVNTGTVTLQPPSITDTMTRLNGTAGGPIGTLSAPVESGTANNLLDVGETWTYTATYSIILADVNAGGFENTATATATDLLGNTASDVSDDGDDGDGNTVDDPTRIEISSTPSLEVEKVVTTPGLVATDEVVFTITARNTGNVTLTAPDIADTLTQIDGTPVGGTIPAPVLTSGNAGGIDPGEAWVWELRYILTQDDVDAGGLSNTATVTGDPPGGAPSVSDVSRDGDPADGNVTDDPTEMEIIRSPAIEVIKTLVSAGDAVGETVVFDIEVRNAGNVTLTGLSLTSEDLTNFDGSGLTPDSIVQTSGDTTGLLPVNGSSVFRVTYTIQQNDINAGGVLNSATFQATSPTGSPVVDISDTGSGTGSTPTPAPITQIDEITVSKTAGVPTRINGTLTQVVFEIEIENTGNVTQTGVEVVDDLTGFVAPATLVDVDTPAPTGLNGAAGNTLYDGATNTQVLDGAVDLDPGQGGTITLTVRYDIAGGNPASPNTVSVTSDRITVPVTATALVAGITAQPDLFATKTASPQSAILGDTITYTMTFENRLTTAEGALTLIDELPPGLEYTPGTATYNGSATPAPVVVGRQLQWQGVTIGPGETITIALQARITGGESGELTNRAFIVAADGSVVSNIASATVTRRAEALFDCADIIGRVFDDRDFDGVFDEGTEEGLPRVRLVTVDGTLITTDEHGRFSVPCAALPRADIGSNFQLELDDRTLPTGFFVTTENPRILRVTPGTMTVFNFGATFGQLIEIDLTAAAFQPNGQPTNALVQGVERLMQVLGERPSILELDYYRGDESAEVARRNLDALEDLIEQRWRQAASYELRIVTSIARIR
ncbi:beta strand repeat-containing protein [Gymnodinialimonas hymeniacidonis]|uniref:beta strand repeat-containing protein n=1 Tax=Gymnodinialimonas hymeniacidonis TaxID=3126508 RepID=UPI0034C6BA06